VAAPRRSSHGGGLDLAHAANSGSSAAGSAASTMPPRPRDAAVSAALGLSRRLSGAGGVALWQQDLLRGPQHGSASHLPAHIYQVRAVSTCVQDSVLGSLRNRVQALAAWLLALKCATQIQHRALIMRTCQSLVTTALRRAGCLSNMLGCCNRAAQTARCTSRSRCSPRCALHPEPLPPPPAAISSSSNSQW